jgi:hypothetical protein
MSVQKDEFRLTTNRYATWRSRVDELRRENVRSLSPKRTLTVMLRRSHVPAATRSSLAHAVIRGPSGAPAPRSASTGGYTTLEVQTGHLVDTSFAGPH